MAYVVCVCVCVGVRELCVGLDIVGDRRIMGVPVEESREYNDVTRLRTQRECEGRHAHIKGCRTARRTYPHVGKVG